VALLRGVPVKVEARTVSLYGDGGVYGTLYIESTGKVRVVMSNGPTLHSMPLTFEDFKSLGLSLLVYSVRLEPQ
jgi:hypothetical protein